MLTNDGKSEMSTFTDFDRPLFDAGSAPWKFLDCNSQRAQYLPIFDPQGYGIYHERSRGARRMVIQVAESNTYLVELVVGYWNDGNHSRRQPDPQRFKTVT